MAVEPKEPAERRREIAGARNAASVVLYFALTFVLFWDLSSLGGSALRLLRTHSGCPSPGVAALIMTGIAKESRVRALVRRFSYGRAAPAGMSSRSACPSLDGSRRAVATRFGAFSAANLRAVIPVLTVSWIMFLFAAVEELGWRGFALPRLLTLRRALPASLILGTLHATWHWPAVVPASAWNDIPRLAPGLLRGTTLIVAEAVLITWMFQHTRGSLLLVTLYHGMTNVALVLYQGIEGMPWLRPSISVLMATGVVLATGPTWCGGHGCAKMRSRSGARASADVPQCR